MASFLRKRKKIMKPKIEIDRPKITVKRGTQKGTNAVF
jgi:hypothetical protein